MEKPNLLENIMQRNTQKPWKIIAASLVAMTSYLNADYDNAQVRNLENRVNALEQKKGANGMINPNGRPEVRDGADIFLTADVLLWQAHEGGLGYAIKSHKNNFLTGNGNFAELLNHTDVENPHFDYDWGFRIGAGYNTAHDGWDLYAAWTRIHLHANGHTQVPADRSKATWPTFIPSNATAFNEGSFANYGKIDAHWRLHLNIIDLELGREFFTSKWLTLRPHFGLRTGWIYQRYDIYYKKSFIFDPMLIIKDGKTAIDMKNNFWGLGPRLGLDTQWAIGSGFSFFGNASISLLYGFFQTAFHQLTREANGIGFPYASTHNSFRQSTAITDLQLGLRWDHMFDNDRFHFGLQAGWEHHKFFSQNHFTRYVTQNQFVVNQGNLTTQGWTLSARFDF